MKLKKFSKFLAQIDYECPYHAAACSASIGRNSSKWTFSNLGQVVQGPAFDKGPML
jgi:hypothetical protein